MAENGGKVGLRLIDMLRMVSGGVTDWDGGCAAGAGRWNGVLVRTDWNGGSAKANGSERRAAAGTTAVVGISDAETGRGGEMGDFGAGRTKRQSICDCLLSEE